MEQDWLKSLSSKDRSKAKRMIAALTRLGAHDPEGWIRSEMQEDIPQVARYLFLRSIWKDLIDRWQTDMRYIPQPGQEVPPVNYSASFGEVPPALQRMVNAGVDPADIAAFARRVAYETVFPLLYKLSDPYDSDVDEEDGLPNWTLMEVDAEEELTGRVVDSLYEDLLTMDPSGREGRPKPPDNQA